MSDGTETQGNEQQGDLPTLLVHKPIDLLTFGKPSWMFRDPGPRIEVEDDPIDWQEGEES